MADSETPYIFVSYAHSDMNRTYGAFNLFNFLEALRDAGFRLWVDDEQLVGGMRWEIEIQAGIDRAAYVFIIVTHHSSASDYVRRELARAKSQNKTLVPIIVQPDALPSFGDLHDNQGYVFEGDYGNAFQKLIENFQSIRQSGPHHTFQDLLDAGTWKASEVAKFWRSKIEYPRQKVVGLLFGRSPHRANAYLLVDRDATLKVPERGIQAFLQFTGELENKVIQEYLAYLKAKGRPVWTILVRGPSVFDTDKHEWIYSLPDDDKAVWSESASFIWRSIEAGRDGARHVDFYLNTPNALVMALADKNTTFEYEAYNLVRGNPEPRELYASVFLRAPAKRS